MYKRILLKLSGESLGEGEGRGLSAQKFGEYATQIKAIVDAGVQVGVVIGGGNIFRGLSGLSSGVDRVKGDQMGMLATIINSLGLVAALEGIGCPARLITSVNMSPVGEHFASDKAKKYMEAGEVVVIGGGTGNPFFTTDSASALRGVEIGAEVLLKGTRVDGIYTADPEKDPTATKYSEISFAEVIEKQLKVMDSTAFTMCRDNSLPIVVFDMDTVGNLQRVVGGEPIGTVVK